MIVYAPPRVYYIASFPLLLSELQTSQTSSRRIASAPRLGTTGWFCGTPMAKGKRGGRGAGGGAKGSSRQPAGGVIADNGGDSGESTLLPAPPPRECEPAGASPPVAPSGVGHGHVHPAGWTTASPDVTLVHHTHAQGSGSEASPSLILDPAQLLLVPAAVSSSSSSGGQRLSLAKPKVLV